MALNVGLYGPGFNRWTMTERGRSALTQAPRRLDIGPSSLRWDGDDLVIEIDEWTVPIPRKVKGTIRVSAPSRTTAPFALDANGRHFWQPIAPAARATVAMASPGGDWSGEAYIDSNWGSEPLEDGFRSWNWSRAALPDGAGVYYDAIARDGEERHLALRFDEKATVRHIPLPARQKLPPGPIWRVARETPVAGSTQAKTLAMLEDTPFYTRSRIATSFDDERVTAVHESLDLDRFSKPWVRCLLPFRMPRRP